MKKSLDIVILGAGKGSRMKNDIPKVLNLLNEKPLIDYVIDTAKLLSPQQIILVVGFKKEQVIEHTKNRGVKYVIQEPQLGTGHALQCCKDLLLNNSSSILVLYGDVPKITLKTLKNLYEHHLKEQNDITFLSADVEDSTGYGRIIRKGVSGLLQIVEHKDCSPEELKINEINSGICLLESPEIFNHLKSLKNNNSASEYYLTDIVRICSKILKIGVLKADNYKEILGINTLNQLEEMKDINV